MMLKAKCLQLHLLQKVCNNLEAGIEILGDMEEVVVQAGKPFGFSLSNLASESRETLLCQKVKMLSHWCRVEFQTRTLFPNCWEH
jgi:hypothetical protein